MTGIIDETPEFFAEATKRYRSQHRGRKAWLFLRWIVVLLSLSIALTAWRKSNAFATAGAIAFAILIFFPHLIDDFLIRMRIRRIGPRQSSMAISNDGFRASSESGEIELPWKAFTRAVLFPDGILLFRGRKAFHWIPYRILDDAAQSDILRDLIRSRLQTRAEFGG